MLTEELGSNIKKSLKDLWALEGPEVHFEHPVNPAHGDWSTNIALVVAKTLKRPPLEIAKEITASLPKNRPEVDRVEAVPPGFINFYLSPAVHLRETQKIVSGGDNYGKSSHLKGQKILVEFAHPNTHKEFHIGHLRNISLGESLVRLLEAAGAKVIRVNYQGDVGLHVAKALWGLIQNSKVKSPPCSTQVEAGQKLKWGEGNLTEKMKRLGEAYAAGHRAYEDPATKEEVTAMNEKIYAKDPEIMALWTETRRLSLDYFETIYKRLGSHFDRYFFESEVADLGLERARQAKEAGILKKSEGAVVFDGHPYGLDTRVFITGAGLPTYEAKELGLAFLEFSEFGEVARCIHVVAPEQSSFFKVTFKVEEILDPGRFSGKQEHFAYGYVDLKDGKMRSRSGNVVTAVSLIEAAKEKVEVLIKSDNLSAAEREDIAEKVAVGAVKYTMLKYSPRQKIAFDLKESVTLEGSSGPYLLYAYTRAESILKKVGPLSYLSTLGNLGDLDYKEEELTLARRLTRFPEVVDEAAGHYAPNSVSEYLFKLAQDFNSFYEKSPVLKAETPLKERRLVLTAAAATVLRNGLNLLGLAPPERM